MTRRLDRNQVAGRDRGPKVTVLVALSRIRFRDGEALLRTGQPERFGAAVYIAGYGLECALKARICDDTHTRDLPRQFWHHDLLSLARNTSRWPAIAADRSLRERLLALTAEWDVRMRYTAVRYEARSVLRFITRAKELAKEFVPWP
jgi:hypothetical protein